ncbi:MAG: tryptophan--tRNA ligase [Candidatus Melainabacteria bacterium]|nr:tryptophan--tRNA ligase [Candidatus Melainabacteria bacterium]
MLKKRLLSGIRPTGSLHIGHYLGVLCNWAKLQDEHECFYFIADWHTLTTKYKETKELQSDIIEVAKDIISSGVDPNKSTLYVQSAIPEVAELHLLLSMVTYQNWVERDPTLKDMVRLLAEDERKAQEEVTYGLLGYVVLQTADILSVLGELVPVGKDQVAHLELSRDIARRFNHIYKTDLFLEPKSLLTETPSVLGIDGHKMSKSLNNDIKLVDSEEVTKKKVLQMITDPKKIKITDKGEPNDCQVAYKHYEIFADKKMLEVVQDECRGAKIGCVNCKTRLAGLINLSLSEVRKKREAMPKDKDVLEILNIGNKKARQVVKQTLEKVRDVMKLRTWS